jgi:uncharacterized membrane protein HdeD (DUF308 family)
MNDVLARNWGLVALRGVLALVFGLVTLFDPRLTLYFLVLMFGAYSFIDGAFTIVAVTANRQQHRHWIALLFSGIVGIVIGAVTYLWPGITALALLLLIAAWAVVIGVAQVVAAIRLRKVIRGEWLLALAGVVSVLFGLVVAIVPGAGALAVALWIGSYAILFGVLQIALAFRLRSWKLGHHADVAAHTA